MHMIVQKRRPVLAGRAREFDDVCRHRGFADIETELEQLAVDTRRTPERIGQAHLVD